MGRRPRWIIVLEANQGKCKRVCPRPEELAPDCPPSRVMKGFPFSAFGLMHGCPAPATSDHHMQHSLKLDGLCPIWGPSVQAGFRCLISTPNSRNGPGGQEKGRDALSLPSSFYLIYWQIKRRQMLVAVWFEGVSRLLCLTEVSYLEVAGCFRDDVFAPSYLLR